MRKIHAKARANDPSFIKIAVLTGRVSSSASYPFLIDFTDSTSTRNRSNNGPSQDILRSFKLENRYLYPTKIGFLAKMSESNSYLDLDPKKSPRGRRGKLLKPWANKR